MSKVTNKSIAVLLVIVLQFIVTPLPKAYAYSNPATVPLLTVANFAALAKAAITSPTGPTVLNNGDMGLDSPATCTGFPSPCTAPGTGTMNGGVIQYQNGAALQGQTDATGAVADIGLRTPDQVLGANLNGLTLTQGVYEVSAAATNLTGDLTLNGDADSVFIFHATSTLITSTSSRVLLTGGTQACHVFWKVDSSATFNGNTTMVGTVLAAASITFSGPGATLNGRAIAQTAAITFNNTTVNNSSCAPIPTPTPTPTPTSTPSVSATPTPDSTSSDSSSSASSPDSSEATSTPRPATARRVTSTSRPAIVPTLPNTGMAVSDRRISWRIFGGIFLSAVIFYLAERGDRFSVKQ